MVHYICTGGCKGVSDDPGTCRADDCPKHGQPLTPCHCEDGEHGGVFTHDHNDHAGAHEKGA